MKKIFTLILCSACMRFQIPSSDAFAYKVIGDFTKTINNSDLEFLSVALLNDFNNQKIKTLDIGFVSNTPLSIIQARRFLISMSEDFVCFVNQYPRLSEYMTVFPINEENVSISITINEKLVKNSNDLYIVIASGNEISYYLKDTALLGVGPSIRESFQEAKAKL